MSKRHRDVTPDDLRNIYYKNPLIKGRELFDMVKNDTLFHNFKVFDKVTHYTVDMDILPMTQFDTTKYPFILTKMAGKDNYEVGFR